MSKVTLTIAGVEYVYVAEGMYRNTQDGKLYVRENYRWEYTTHGNIKVGGTMRKVQPSDLAVYAAGI